jgi:hypothetical protein
MYVRLVSFIAGTIIMLVAYVAIQQSYRQTADDPQIRLAEDAAAALSGGDPINALLANDPKTDMSRSLSPFMMIFDDTGRLVNSTAYFNNVSSPAGVPPTPPSGVFDFMRTNDGTTGQGISGAINGFRSSFASNRRPAGEDRFTWQTASGLRFATVVTRWNATSSSGFVLAARSLREVEIREGQLGEIFLMGWLAFVVGTIGAVVVETVIEKRLRV